MQWKNDAGMVYAVRQNEAGEPVIMHYDTSPKWCTGWQLSDFMMGLANKAGADTAAKMQNVLDGHALKCHWQQWNSPVGEENPTDAGAGASDQTKTAAPASGDDPGPVDTPEAMAPAAGAAITPAFDYSGLTDQTIATLHSAENMIHGARRDYVVRVADAVGMVHDELSASHSGTCSNQYTENTFIAWCGSQGIAKTTAYRLLQVSDLMSHSTPNEQAVLEQAPATLLYAAAKPSAPAEAVEAVKSGDIKSMPEYKALLDKIAIKDEAIRNAQKVAECNARRAEQAEFRASRAQQQLENLRSAESAHLTKIRETEKERDGAREALAASKMHADKWRAEAEASRKAPVPATVVDQDEVNRRAKELAAQMVAEQQEESDAAHNAYDAVILACRTFTNTWQTVQPLLSQIPASQHGSARDMLLQKLMSIKEDVEKCL